MIKIILEYKEYDYLLNSSFLTSRLKKLIRVSSQQTAGLYIITISKEQSDELRDMFGEQLQLIGFDEKYNPTPEGEILESLIDKFFTDK